MKRVFWFSLQLLSETFIILRTIQPDITTNVQHTGVHVKYRLYLSDFNKTYIFSTIFRKILKYQISWKSVQWEPSFSTWTDGQTWRSLQTLFAILRTRPIRNQYQVRSEGLAAATTMTVLISEGASRRATGNWHEIPRANNTCCLRYPDDEGSRFFWNVDTPESHYTASCHRRHRHLYKYPFSNCVLVSAERLTIWRLTTHIVVVPHR